MKIGKTLSFGAAAIAIAVFLTSCQSPPQGSGSIGANDLGGVVTSANGPEAGVWVIAETNDLPTKFAKVVVTDDQGRYLIPDLPKANYSVWTRGYGLVDSPKVNSTPGQTLSLTAVPARSAAAAAEYYPGMYWYSMLNIPAKSEFPGTGDKGNGISSNIKTQEQWVDTVKNACQSCHSLGSKGMRTVPKEFGPGVAGWARRTQSGQAMGNMALGLGYMGAEAALKNFADWTDRIAAGAVPFAKPERPQGVERNMVVTMWDFSTPKYYLHDGISTDRNNPRLNANGPIYGAPEESTDLIPALDPVNHKPYFIKHPVPNPKTPSSTELPMQPSAYWGKEPIWDGHSSIHNAMMDSEGRVWFTARIRPAPNPDFCKKGSDHPS
ncbi:MAG TPA: carboxypeptidase-like regulatory domain-containing protein, partial [Burkholderiales bacterium]|nr:carboxypeptidase-like regulatory domain-containing protein [Burkholderiales bacterium]